MDSQVGLQTSGETANKATVPRRALKPPVNKATLCTDRTTHQTLYLSSEEERPQRVTKFEFHTPHQVRVIQKVGEPAAVFRDSLGKAGHETRPSGYAQTATVTLKTWPAVSCRMKERHRKHGMQKDRK